MKHAAKIEGTVEAWEGEQLGADEAHAKVADDHAHEIDAALGLQPISIRLQKSLLDDLKAIASLNGIGYQPLVRQVLTRFADSEKRRLLKEHVATSKRATSAAGHSAELEPSAPATRRAKKAA